MRRRVNTMARGAALAVGIALLLGGCGQQRARAVQKSMEPTIRSGEIVTVDRSAYDDAPPHVGDIVLVIGPAGARSESCGAEPSPGAPCARPTLALGDEEFIKRIVAGPGERVAIDDDGTAIVAGARLREAYVLHRCEPQDECGLPRSVTVPRGHYFLLGDNRPYSSDSRAWGPVPRSSILGRVSAPGAPAGS